jgi:thymidylate kinase
MLTAPLVAWAAQYEVIVLDGCDGTGKSTLATALATYHGYDLIHSARTPDGTDIIRRYRSILAQAGQLVLDRSFISELVYGPLLHDHARLSFAEAVGLAAIVAGRGGTLVHLTGQPEKIADRLLARDGYAPALQRIQAITAAYTRVFTGLASHASVITIDSTATPT